MIFPSEFWCVPTNGSDPVLWFPSFRAATSGGVLQLYLWADSTETYQLKTISSPTTPQTLTSGLY